jgi:2-beta-glucuronyltransferase
VHVQVRERPKGHESASGPKVVILSAFQDYRSRKRASIQHVADGLVRSGYDVSFISTRFSYLSKRTGDSRLFLSSQANRVETVNGVRCFLWRTLLHPFGSKRASINAVMAPFFSIYSNLPNRVFDKLIQEADFVVVESGVAVIYLQRIRRLNGRAKIIYYAADRLDTVGAHPYVQRQLEAASELISHVCLRSSAMKDGFRWAAGRLFKAEFGINKDDFLDIGPSPYGTGAHAVSVGSMLFDASYFQRVAEHHPDVTFHVIGCGANFSAAKNVCIYPEMKFKDTLPYLNHATIGIAPYKSGVGVEYLAESSLKLAQYEYLGLPAVCPNFAAGGRSARFGYDENDTASMVEATRSALAAAGTVGRRDFPTWEEVGSRMLSPETYSAGRIEL